MNKFVISAVFAGVVALTPSVSSAQAVVTIPNEVETYVVKESGPSVAVQGDVIVGSELPDTVVLRPVPKYDTYSYAVVNNQRVIVEGKTRKIVKVIK